MTRTEQRKAIQREREYAHAEFLVYSVRTERTQDKTDNYHDWEVW